MNHMLTFYSKSRIVLAGFFVLSVLNSCGDESLHTSTPAPLQKTPEVSTRPNPVATTFPSATPVHDIASVPQLPASSSRADIVVFLNEKKYSGWLPESAVRPSVRAHGTKVRTFLNSALENSLRAQNLEHPVGSAAVKELYEEDGLTLRGYAYEVKVREGSDGDAWVWYEAGLQPDSGGIYGQGNTTCTTCHGSAGVDFVRAHLPE